MMFSMIRMVCGINLLTGWLPTYTTYPIYMILAYSYDFILIIRIQDQQDEKIALPSNEHPYQTSIWNLVEKHTRIRLKFFHIYKLFNIKETSARI